MLNKFDYRYKKFLKLEREYDEVCNKLYSLPMIKLAQPYQRGWHIMYDLRADIKGRKDANFISEAVDIGFGVSSTKNVAVVRAIRAGKTSIKGKKGQTVPLEPHRISLSEVKFRLLSPEVAKYFKLDEMSHEYKKWGYKIYKAQLPRYWLVIKAKPNMITHIPRKGGVLESECVKLRDALWQFWNEKCNYSKSYPRGTDRTQVRSEIQKFKNGEREDVNVKDIKWEYKY